MATTVTKYGPYQTRTELAAAMAAADITDFDFSYLFDGGEIYWYGVGYKA